MKQTAVQWLVEKYAIVMGLGSKELMKEHIERAKEMERGQIVEAHRIGSAIPSLVFATSTKIFEVANKDEVIKSISAKLIAEAENYYNDEFGQ